MRRQGCMETPPPGADYSRVSSATAFLAQASSTISLPSEAAAMSACHRGVVEGPGDPARESVQAHDRVVGEELVTPSCECHMVAQVGRRVAEVHRGDVVADGHDPVFPSR
jgi:hypothetical protein